MASSLETINSTSDFRKLTFTVNDIEIIQNYITDIEISYDASFKITGYILINDDYDFQTELFKKPGEILSIYLEDRMETVFKRDFVITRTKEQKSQDSKAIKILIQDIFSWKLENCYIGKSYKETTLIDVLKDYLSLNELDGYPEIERSFKSGKETKTLKNFVVPNHINFLDFISDEFFKEHNIFYQDRLGLYVGPQDITVTKEAEYLQTTTNDFYGFKIMDYNLVHNDILQTNYTAPKQTYTIFNPRTKKFDIFSETINDFMDEFKQNKIQQKVQLTNGTKYKTSELNSHQYRDHKIYYNNTKLNISVPGLHEYARLYREITIRLSGDITTKETLDQGDAKLSGKYYISSVNDKILLGQRFIQKFEICRIDESKKV